MNKLNRRSMLQLLGAAPVAAGFTWTEAEAAQAAQVGAGARASRRPASRRSSRSSSPRTSTRPCACWSTSIIPKDERSGSATDAGVPEFMDFMMDRPRRTARRAMRGGLAWIDLECEDRFDKRFLDCTPEQRTAVLDDIAWPQKAKPEFAHGVAFFNSFRDLTASGFFSSKMGVAGPQVPGQRDDPRVEWLPARGVEEVRRLT